MAVEGARGQGWGTGGRGGCSHALAPSSLLRTAFLLLLLISAAWLLGLLAVNSDGLVFHYLFAAFSCLQVRAPPAGRADVPGPGGASAGPALVRSWVACGASRLKCPNPKEFPSWRSG